MFPPILRSVFFVQTLLYLLSSVLATHIFCPNITHPQCQFLSGTAPGSLSLLGGSYASASRLIPICVPLDMVRVTEHIGLCCGDGRGNGQSSWLESVKAKEDVGL